MKIFCIGRNYALHAKELGNAVPKQPLVFMKPPTALLIKDRTFYYPDFSNDIHYEAEIVVRIAKNGKRVQPEFASEYYDAIAFGIDFTARDIQAECKRKGHPWEIAKGFDSSAPISEFTPLPELGKTIDNISFELHKNGQVVQSGNTSDLLFNVEHLICHISKYFKIQQGDYIYTGTPEGVGPIERGDVLEGFIEGAKRLHCQIK